MKMPHAQSLRPAAQNAHGHVTIAILCWNLQESARAPAHDAQFAQARAIETLMDMACHKAISRAIFRKNAGTRNRDAEFV